MKRNNQAFSTANGATLDAKTRKTHSNVGSSLQIDRCGSSDPARGQPDDSSLVADCPPLVSVQGTRIGTPSPSVKQADTIIEDGDGDVPVQPAPKRRRVIGRAKVPAPLQKEQLEVTHRYEAEYREPNPDGHYIFSLGDNLTPRFKIMRKFGEGTFGRVVECWDRHRSSFVAVKIIRAVEKYRDAAMVELQVLATLSEHDTAKNKHIVKLLEWFDYRGHVCMVFERLGPSVFDCLRKNNYRPLPFQLARDIMHQVLQSVAFMHELGITHTDLKPENVLFVDDDLELSVDVPEGSRLARFLPPTSQVRLIDYGSATFEDAHHSSIVSTRHYRAPEIILSTGWSHECDIWSLGCILVELLTGDALFQTHENCEHLSMMESVLGPIPQSLIDKAMNQGGGRHVYNSSGKLRWPSSSDARKSLKITSKMKGLREHLLAQVDVSVHPVVDTAVGLLRSMLAYEPGARCSAHEALNHPFFSIAL